MYGKTGWRTIRCHICSSHMATEGTVREAQRVARSSGHKIQVKRGSYAFPINICNFCDDA